MRVISTQVISLALLSLLLLSSDGNPIVRTPTCVEESYKHDTSIDLWFKKALRGSLGKFHRRASPPRPRPEDTGGPGSGSNDQNPQGQSGESSNTGNDQETTGGFGSSSGQDQDQGQTQAQASQYPPSRRNNFNRPSTKGDKIIPAARIDVAKRASEMRAEFQRLGKQDDPYFSYSGFSTLR